MDNDKSRLGRFVAPIAGIVRLMARHVAGRFRRLGTTGGADAAVPAIGALIMVVFVVAAAGIVVSPTPDPSAQAATLAGLTFAAVRATASLKTFLR